MPATRSGKAANPQRKRQPRKPQSNEDRQSQGITDNESARPEANQTDNGVTQDTAVAGPRNSNLSEQLKELQATITQIQAEKQALQSELDAARVTGATPEVNSVRQQVPRPKGSAGMDWSIEVAMGLDGSQEKHETYKALQRHIQELTLNARINWELPWLQVPAQEKANLYQVARERHPILGRYVNDWATEELVKQYVKNKRKHAYTKHYLEVPEKYGYLKANASKRSTAPRVRRARLGAATEGGT